MTGFSAEWLALREPHDSTARAHELVEPLRARIGRSRAIVDLGAGSGANLRWLSPKLGGEQAWLLVDHDPALLAASASALRDWAAAHGASLRGAGTKNGDGDDSLADGTELVVTGADFESRVRRARADLAADLDRIELPERGLVTSSALLDLVSAEWLDALARRCRAAAADVYFALTYDGRTACAPADAGDGEALELFNRHQRGDKGFGAALGPTAAPRARDAFAALGYRVTTCASDWRIGPGAASFQRELLAGWLGAAVQIAPRRRAALDAWHRRRVAHVDAGVSTLVVGHVDLIGICAP